MSGDPSQIGDFRSSVGPAIERFRSALRSVLEAQDTHVLRSPTRLGRKLGIDTKLAWKLTNVLASKDPFEAGQYLPGSAALEIFLGAAETAGVAAAALEETRDSAAELDQLVRLHAGNRRAFGMLLAGQASGGKERADLDQRKKAFEAGGYILGVQAKLQLKTFILAPSPETPTFDALVLAGFVSLRRLRPEVPWRISRTYSVDDAGAIRSDIPRSDLNEASETKRELPTLLEQFSSDPLPQFEEVPSPHGADYRLAPGAVGDRAAFTLMTGELLRGAEPRVRQEGFEISSLHARLRTAIEALVFDVFVHDSLWQGVEPKAALYSDLFSDASLTRPPDCDRLEIHDPLEPCARGGASIPEFPRYGELLDFAFQKASWRADEFRCYRMRMRFPPVPGVLFVDHELPNP